MQTNHVAVVTGGNRGIGLGLARGLAKAGSSVAVWSRDPARNRDAVAELDEETFARRFVAEIARQIPSRDDFYISFYFDVELAYVPLPSLLAEEQAEAERYTDLLDDLRTYGDCTAGYRVAVESPKWLNYVQRGLETGAITI